jgi:hypothetical protein
MVSFLATDAGKAFVQSWSVYTDPTAMLHAGQILFHPANNFFISMLISLLQAHLPVICNLQNSD